MSTTKPRPGYQRIWKNGEEKWIRPGTFEPIWQPAGWSLDYQPPPPPPAPRPVYVPEPPPPPRGRRDAPPQPGITMQVSLPPGWLAAFTGAAVALTGVVAAAIAWL